MRSLIPAPRLSFLLALHRALLVQYLLPNYNGLRRQKLETKQTQRHPKSGSYLPIQDEVGDLAESLGGQQRGSL